MSYTRLRGARGRALAALSLALLAVGCSKLYEYPATDGETTSAACSDGLDNDLDGRADCYDLGCASFCVEDSADTCSDGLDNDVDESVDCLDLDCLDFCREDSADTCADELDNDADGDLDCQDADCADFCPETGSQACADELDNDFDELVDCDDPDCDGHCPEESLAECADGRDNDGDTLTDATDPRCWLIDPPQVQRCALPNIDFRERFEGAPATWNANPLGARWTVQGTLSLRALSVQVQTRPLVAGARSDLVAAFLSLRDDAPGKLISKRVFAGSWSNLELTFSVRLEPQSRLKLALIPKTLAAAHGPDTRLPETGAAVRLDYSDSTALVTLFAADAQQTAILRPRPFQACGDYPCDSRWLNVRLKLVAGALEATVEGGQTPVQLTSAPLAELELAPSSLVIWGQSAGLNNPTAIDDLYLRIASPRPCGVVAPQLPAADCESARAFPNLGGAVALARDQAGAFCALVEGKRPDESRALTAWSSTDGQSWSAAAPNAPDASLALPPFASLAGVGLTYDSGELFAAAVLREPGSTYLALMRGTSCSSLSFLARGPALPDDAEGPSYLVADGRHQVYFTRPATDQSSRSLWRVSGRDPEHLELQPQPVTELPLELPIRAPVSLTRAGATDLVMVYRLAASAGAPGLGMAIGSADARSWQAVPTVPLLATQAGTFDDSGPTAAAFSYAGSEGLFLYGGNSAGGVRTGTARLFPAGTTLPELEAAGCGDGRCSADESCSTCAADCSCPGQLVSDGGRASGGAAWQELSHERLRPLYFAADTRSLVVNSAAQAVGFLPLDSPIIGDFELDFDLTVPWGTDETHRNLLLDSLYIGLGTAPQSDSQLPRGMFARLTMVPSTAATRPCLADDERYGLSPFWNAGARVGSTLEGTPTDCDAARLSLPFESTWHIKLARQSDSITLSARDANGCSRSLSLPQREALPSLSTLVVGNYNYEFVGGPEISNLELRVPDAEQPCSDGETLCVTGADARACVDTSSSPDHCGACGSPCQPGAACRGGSCTCPEGWLSCPEECVDALGSTHNCGACDRACSDYCLLGECDAGASCDHPKQLPPGPGRYPFDLSKVPTQRSVWCGQQEIVAARLVFAWTPLQSGFVRFTLQSSVNEFYVLFELVGDPDCAPETDLVLSCHEGGLWDLTKTVPVEAGTLYHLSFFGVEPQTKSRATLTIEEL